MFFTSDDFGTLKAFNSNDNAKLQVGVNIMSFSSRRNLLFCPNSEAFSLTPNHEIHTRSYPPVLRNVKNFINSIQACVKQ